jgi:hypothetical protein
MRIKNIISGLQIIAAYQRAGVDVGHEVIYGYSAAEGKDDYARLDQVNLEELDWFWDEESTCWSIFV